MKYNSRITIYYIQVEAIKLICPHSLQKILNFGFMCLFLFRGNFIYLTFNLILLEYNYHPFSLHVPLEVCHLHQKSFLFVFYIFLTIFDKGSSGSGDS